MTDRNINGDVQRSRYRQARKVADELGISPEAMEVLAEGVREFDSEQSNEARRTKALEKIAEALTPRRGGDDRWEWEERRLRRREVYAQELMAVAVILDDDIALAEIQNSPNFQALVARLRREPNASVPDSAIPSA